mgnify:CR=1 FL=1
MSLWDIFLNNQKIEKRTGTGQKIKRIRSRKKTAVIELAEAAGVNETAVRNYEIGYRQASRDKLELIAQRLGVPVETLIDRQIDSYNDAVHILFELSEKYDLVPIELPQEPKYAIQTKMKQFFKHYKHGITRDGNGRTGISHKLNCKSGWMRFLCSVKKTNLRQKKWNPVQQLIAGWRVYKKRIYLFAASQTDKFRFLFLYNSFRLFLAVYPLKFINLCVYTLNDYRNNPK